MDFCGFSTQHEPITFLTSLGHIRLLCGESNRIDIHSFREKDQRFFRPGTNQSILLEYDLATMSGHRLVIDPPLERSKMKYNANPQGGRRKRIITQHLVQWKENNVYIRSVTFGSVARVPSTLST
jgi:hypothetical protein